MPRVPINVGFSIFNNILPIRDWWSFHLNDGHLNNGHWLIRTQAWAISAKDWDMTFFHWSIAWYVSKKIGVSKFWGSLHSRNASFDGGGTMWRRNRISPNTTKGRLLWINGHFRWHFIFVSVEQIVHFPQKLRRYEKKSKRMLNGHTVSDLWWHCMKLCTVRKSTPPFGLKCISFRVWHLCNDG